MNTVQSDPRRFDNPGDCTIWPKSFGQNITWSKPGKHDPKFVTLQLINNDFPNTLPEPFVTLAKKVPTEWQSFEFEVVLPKADGYVILMVDPENEANIVRVFGLLRD